MASQVKLFLIRHGETVDNVAQVYAGSKDSELTNHGYQQATRLGQHFKSLGLSFTHIFSSHLQRAAKTAGLIREAQASSTTNDGSAPTVPDLIQLPALMEQDFGWYEGKKFSERPAGARWTGKDHHRRTDRTAEGFVDMESKESMARRIGLFLDEHLIPILVDGDARIERAICIVSHGIILSVLWKCLLLRLPPRSVALSSELSARDNMSLEHLGGWSNTGYLELYMSQILTQTPAVPSAATSPTSSMSKSITTSPDVGVSSSNSSPAVVASAPRPSSDLFGAISQRSSVVAEPPVLKLAHGWTTLVQTINGRDHLKGLKRTGGGVGSSRHDSSQKNIDSFFKRRKLE